MTIRRLLLFSLLTLVPLGALAFDPTPRPETVLVIERAASHHRGGIGKAFVGQLREDLRQQGFEVIESDLTFEDLLDQPHAAADYVVELAGENANTSDYGGIGLGGRHAEVGLSIVGSRVVARLLIYDGPTLTLLGDRTLTQRASAVVPSSIGFGSRAFYTFVGLPILESAQQRSIARTLGREGASWVLSVIRGETEAPE